MANGDGDSPNSRRRIKQEMTLQWTVQSAAAAAGVAEHQQSPSLQPAEFYEDEACSLVDSTAWHENDLILAAELGKALLERNRDLELQLSGLRGLCDHQAQEVELLARQVATLRGLNDGKARMVEEVDRQCADLEAQNRALASERTAARERANGLAGLVAGLEARVEELVEQLSERAQLAATAGANRQEATTETDRRQSRRNGGDASEDTSLDSAAAAETARLVLLASSSRRQVVELTERNEALEVELARQLRDGDRARQEAARLRRDLAERWRQAQPQTTTVRRPQQRPTPTPLRDAEEFDEFLGEQPDDSDLASRIESDEQQIGGDAGCGQLRSGGTVFSSEENLSRLGATKKLADTALAEVSLLAELNEQYNRLVVEYEQLLAGKQSRVQAASSQTPVAAAAAAAFEQRLTGIFAEETRSERKRLTNQDYRPKYKDLFRDAMSKLRDMKTGTTGGGGSQA